MTYNEFKRNLELGHKFTKEEYYSHVVEHKNAILIDIAKQGQVATGKDLGIHQTKLSAIAEILKVLPW